MSPGIPSSSLKSSGRWKIQVSHEAGLRRLGRASDAQQTCSSELLGKK